MERRQLLKLAPLAMLGALPVKAEGANAYELQTNKRYIFLFKPGAITEKDLDTLAANFRELGLRGMAMFGEDPELTIYELEAKSQVSLQ